MNGWEWEGMRSEKVLWGWVKRKEMGILVRLVAVGVNFDAS